MLQIEPSKKLPRGRHGKFEFKNGEVLVVFDEMRERGEIDHTNIHASGASQTKLKDGSLSINYSEANPGTPLVNLKSVKHLGTLITRDIRDEEGVEISRLTDIPIERMEYQKSSVIDLLAVPKNANINLNAEWDMKNDRPVRLNVGFWKMGFNGFDVIALVRSSDQFDKVPPATLHILDMNDFVPFVLELDDKKARIQLSHLKFEKVIQTNTHNSGEHIVITATSKYL